MNWKKSRTSACSIQRWTFLPTCTHGNVYGVHGNSVMNFPAWARVYIHMVNSATNFLAHMWNNSANSKRQFSDERFCPSEVTIKERTIQRWVFSSNEFYYTIILLIYLHDIHLLNFNIGAHWLTFLLIYLSNWAEMRLNTTLSVPNFHLNAHILCERVLNYQLGVKLQLQ